MMYSVFWFRFFGLRVRERKKIGVTLAGLSCFSWYWERLAAEKEEEEEEEKEEAEEEVV